MFIYVITNQINGKKYVGQTTKSIENRWRRHKAEALRVGDRPICRAIKKYGAENFTIEQLGWAQDIDQLNRFEIAAIAQLNTLAPSGYNLQSGGENYTAHEVTKEKIRKARLGTKSSDETRAKISAANVGKTMSQEARDKISAGSKGRPESPEHRASMSRTRKGRVPWNKGKTGCYSEETLEKMAAWQRGRVASDETRAKLSAALIGHKRNVGAKQSPEHIASRISARAGYRHTEETITKMSESQKARWARKKAAEAQL